MEMGTGCLYVGGPLDGQRRTVDGPRPIIEIPVLDGPPDSAIPWPPDPPKDRTYHVELYMAEWFKLPEMCVVYFHESVGKGNDAYTKALINGYRQPKVTHAQT